MQDLRASLLDPQSRGPVTNTSPNKTNATIRGEAGLRTSAETLSNGRSVPVVRVPVDASPAGVAESLGLLHADALLLLIGGAGLMPDATMEQLRACFDTLAETLAVRHVTVIDGGTRAGVVELMGTALDRAGRTAPYIGVVPARADIEPGGPRAQEILEPHHSHFVLVDSDQWGAEIQLMQGLAAHLAPGGPGLVLLVNGGDVALRELEAAADRGYETIVLAGSGRLADELAQALRQPERPIRAQIAELTTRARLSLLDVSAPRAAVRELLESRLRPSGGASDEDTHESGPTECA
jgi:hypothetical protein